MFEQMKENDFMPTTFSNNYLRNGKYGVKITQIELARTDPKPESGKQPQDFVNYHLEVVEPKEFAGISESLKFYHKAKGEAKYGPDKDTTYNMWNLLDKTIALWQAKFFKLPQSVLSDENKLIDTLTTKTNETLTEKVFYIEKKPQKDNPKYSNVNFLSIDAEKAGELGAYADETQEAAESIASNTTITDADNPFAREEVANNDGEDDDWLNK